MTSAIASLGLLVLALLSSSCQASAPSDDSTCSVLHDDAASFVQVQLQHHKKASLQPEIEQSKIAAEQDMDKDLTVELSGLVGNRSHDAFTSGPYATTLVPDLTVKLVAKYMQPKLVVTDCTPDNCGDTAFMFMQFYGDWLHGVRTRDKTIQAMANAVELGTLLPAIKKRLPLGFQQVKNVKKGTSYLRGPGPQFKSYGDAPDAFKEYMEAEAATGKVGLIVVSLFGHFAAFEIVMENEECRAYVIQSNNKEFHFVSWLTQAKLKNVCKSSNLGTRKATTLVTARQKYGLAISTPCTNFMNIFTKDGFKEYLGLEALDTSTEDVVFYILDNNSS